MQNSSPELSVVIPVFNEAGGIDTLFSRVVPILNGVTEDWEILCVNDGSRDATLAELKAWHKKESRIKALSLSRNFGKELALTAGLHHARGQAVIPMDADLQDPPELIPEMVAKWREGYKVVLATRKSRRGEGLFKRAAAAAYYKLMGNLLTIKLPPQTGDFRLMDQQVVEVVRLLPERTRFMKGLFAWVGFSTAQIYFDRPPRAVGSAKQGVRALWQLAKDGLFSFTTLPLRLTTYLGLIISLVAFGYGGWLIVRTMLFGADVPGYASIMAGILCMGGVQLVCLGILGEYVGRIYRESKQRPLFVVEEKIGL